MSEDCHNSDNVSPEDFEREKAYRKRILQAAYEAYKPYAKMQLQRKAGPAHFRAEPEHLGRWEELTLEDFKFLYELRVSCE